MISEYNSNDNVLQRGETLLSLGCVYRMIAKHLSKEDIENMVKEDGAPFSMLLTN